MKAAAWLTVACLALPGCEKVMQNMYDQPRYKPFAVSPLFADGTSARVPPSGTVPHVRGAFAGTSSARAGRAAMELERADQAAPANPYPVSRELLERGRERYTIYCVPCHSPLGDGDGLVARRGFPHPPTYHSERLRKAPDRHFFDVISQGYGIMYSYADRVEAADRWAIVAYIRALQLSQEAKVGELPEAVRHELAARGGEAK
ncbi:MAG: c-type cytochrome [Bacteroidota bacterium]